MRRRTVTLAGGAALALLVPLAALGADLPQVSLDQARADLEAGRILLFDVRETAEHAAGVARGARLLPLSQLSQRAGEIPRQPDKPVYLICNTQNRSQTALRALLQNGWTRVHFVQGGMSEWKARGWPMVKP